MQLIEICTGLMLVGYGMMHEGETSLSHMGGVSHGITHRR
jgi:hypothetical protein